MNKTNPKIGVFWGYSGCVFGKAVSLDTGFSQTEQIRDSNETHADVWDSEKPWLQVSKDLAFKEYQDVPRGRVLFNHHKGKPLVYADKKLLTPEFKKLIADFFEFVPENAIWKRDDHYTTSQDELAQLFDDDLD